MSVLTPDRPYLRSVGDEPLPGYRLVAPLGQGGFGEVWKCVAPGGLSKAIKFVLEEKDDDSSLRQEYDAFLRVKGIRHPFLLTLERVELIRDELLMVMELADESLAQRYDACRAAGRTGIDRRQLLAYMVDTAEALDVLSGEHGLQHLDIKPANLFLMGGHVKVGDYGLVARYRRGSDGLEPRLGRGLTPKYVAPEILSDQVNSRTDQYSLALVYHELLTGAFPYSGKSAQQLMLQHASAEPDLRALPERDVEAVRRALSKSPPDRFPSCLAFVRSLLQYDPASEPISIKLTRRVRPVGQTPAPPRLGQGLSSGCLTVNNTLRLSPAVTLRPGATAEEVAAEELALACPDLRYLGEGKAGPRGRLIRAADTASGVTKAVRLLRLDGGTAADLDDLYRALAAPLPGATQAVIFPQPRLLAVVWDADTRTLRDWLAAAPPEPPARATVGRLLEPLGPLLDGLHAAAGCPHLLLSSSAVLCPETVAAGVTGFGVGEALRRSRANTDWLTDHSYAAPEAVAGTPGRSADQFALALIYLELRRAWFADTPRDRTGAPRVNWDALPKDERAAVRRALARNPAERFESCAAFLAAVRSAAANVVVLERVQLLESTARLAGENPPPTPPPEPADFAAAVVALAQAGVVTAPPPAEFATPAIRQADGRYALRFPVRLSGQLATLKLSVYTAQNGFTAVPMGDGGVLLKMRRGRGAIELFVQLPSAAPVTVSELTVCGRSMSLDHGPKAVEQVAAALDHFRRAFQNADERRSNTRWRYEGGVTLYPVDDELAIGRPIRGRARDVSASGFAVLLPGDPPAGHLFAAFDGPGLASGWAALARVVRAVPHPSGLHLVAGHFLFAGG